MNPELAVAIGYASAIALSAFGSAIGTGMAGLTTIGAGKRCFLQQKPFPFITMAFVGAVQLRPFGAQIYVADLVGLAMAREMGAMMAAIIMAGRTGASFAAQLGTMTVNEEIDALRTLGISPIEFLVLPRVLALALMMPFLCLYADLMGLAGGAVVGVFMLEIPLWAYINETTATLVLSDFAQGWIKSAVFGVVVALAGCLRGMQCGRSSEAVGIATTSAVVTAIVWIIVWDSIFAVVFHVLGY